MLLLLSAVGIETLFNPTPPDIKIRKLFLVVSLAIIRHELFSSTRHRDGFEIYRVRTNEKSIRKFYTNSPIVRSVPSNCLRCRRPIVIPMGVQAQVPATCQILVVANCPRGSCDCTKVSNVDSLCCLSFVLTFESETDFRYFSLFNG